jgi:uncharacterized iron-regulated membrane protein
MIGNRLRQWRTRAVTAVRGNAPKTAQPKRNLTMVLRDWHKRAGLFAFIFMGWLGFSGILLNQSASLGFDTVRIDWRWLTAMYGLHAEPPSSGFSASGHWLASVGDKTVLDGKPLSTAIEVPRGFASGGTLAPTLFVAASDSLVLLSPTGNRLDELRSPTLPISAIRRIGIVKNSGKIAIQDLDAFQSADDGETWTPVTPTDVEWSNVGKLSDDQRSKLLPFARPTVILEQVLIDAHSGRLFGHVGPYVINTVGLAALWLSCSGVWMMWRTSRRRRA